MSINIAFYAKGMQQLILAINIATQRDVTGRVMKKALIQNQKGCGRVDDLRCRKNLIDAREVDEQQNGRLSSPSVRLGTMHSMMIRPIRYVRHMGQAAGQSALWDCMRINLTQHRLDKYTINVRIRLLNDVTTQSILQKNGEPDIMLTLHVYKVKSIPLGGEARTTNADVMHLEVTSNHVLAQLEWYYESIGKVQANLTTYLCSLYRDTIPGLTELHVNILALSNGNFRLLLDQAL
ncbi:hypothetical protein P692DRAFT_20820276 [Suillus brevipes Sb2]|nr:hypothetical protein P692DRAFT_20820276 [Suillus brevipes Sb2]